LGFPRRKADGRLRRVIAGLLALVVMVGAAGFALRLYMSRAVEDRLRPDERVVIANLRDPIPQNAFLACPPDYCAAAAAASPIFAVPVDRLMEAWDQMIAADSADRVAVEREGRRLVLIEHTPLLRFPDIVTIEFVAVSPDRSSLAIYSRSRYGRGDFGTNRRRVLGWLSALRRKLG
jgi:uncharacterized protein (DUF1499 family)